MRTIAAAHRCWALLGVSLRLILQIRRGHSTWLTAGYKHSMPSCPAYSRPDAWAVRLRKHPLSLGNTPSPCCGQRGGSHTNGWARIGSWPCSFLEACRVRPARPSLAGIRGLTALNTPAHQQPPFWGLMATPAWAAFQSTRQLSSPIKSALPPPSLYMHAS